MTKTEEIKAMERNRTGWKNLFRTKQRKPQQRVHNQNKFVLFQLNESEISVYKPLIGTHDDMISVLKYQSSSLISQGKFKVYKMDQNGTNYFQCGEVIHPILPNAKVIKVNPDTYILPMRNPNRYWKLSLNSSDDPQLSIKFESVIDRICKYQINQIDFQLTSPFNSFIDDESLHIHQPIPINCSIPSMKSSLLLNDDLISLSINSIGKQLEIDLDDELNKNNIMIIDNNKNENNINDNDNYHDDMDDLDDTLITFERKGNPQSRGNKLTNRFSLTFKSIDYDEPMAIDDINKFSEDEIKNIIQMEPTSGFSKYLFG